MLETPNTNLLPDIDVDSTPRVSPFFIDRASLWSVFSSLSVLLAFLLLHVLAALRAPLDHITKTEFYKPEMHPGISSCDIDFTLGALQPLHHFIKLHFSIVSDTVSTPLNLPFGVVVYLAEISDRFVTHTRTREFRNLTARFNKGQNHSLSQRLLHIPIHQFNLLQGRMNIRTDVQKVRAIVFTWELFNPSAVRYARTAKLLSSILIGYLLGVFIFYSKFDSDIWTQCFLIVLGITGVIASDPLGILTRLKLPLFLSLDVLPALFVCLYRAFLLLGLELLRSRSTKPSIQFLACLILFFASYAIVDGLANSERRAQIAQETTFSLPNEIARSQIGIVYLIIALGYCAVAAISSDRPGARKLLFFAVSTVLTGIVTVVVQIWPVWDGSAKQYSLFPQMLMSGVHSSFVAITLFMFHCVGDPDYRGIYGKETETDLEVDPSQSGGRDPV
jgi:hypothetical protein